MARYNLYLMDVTRDQRIIRRLGAVTGVKEGVLRRALRRPPFIVLKERNLSEVVGLRREFELQGLSLQMEKVEPEDLTGDTRHPLWEEPEPEEEKRTEETPAQPAGKRRRRRKLDEAATGNAREIVLEEGTGFREIDPGERADSIHHSKDRTAGRAAAASILKTRSLRIALAVVVLLLAGIAGWLILKDLPGERTGRTRLAAELQTETAGLELRLQSALRQASLSDKILRQLLEDVDRLEALAQQAWRHLPAGQRRSVEELQSMRRTLELRHGTVKRPPGGEEGRATNEGRRVTSRLVTSVAAFARPEADSLSLVGSVLRERDQASMPASLEAVKRLEFLIRDLDSLRVAGGSGLRRVLDELQPADGEADLRLRARAMAGAIRHKGVHWLPRDGALGLADLPDETRLRVDDDAGDTHQAIVRGGLVVMHDPPRRINPVSAALLPLERQPGPVRRILEAGLRIFSPEVFFATIPGSTLGRQDPASRLAESAGRLPADILREAIRRGRLPVSVIETRAGLELQVEDGTPAALVLELVDECARSYVRARSWPRRLTVTADNQRYEFSGSDLWLLTRGGIDS